MEKKNHSKYTNLTLPLPSSSSIPIFNYYQVHPFSNFHFLPPDPESRPVKRRFWFLLIDLLSINRDALSGKRRRKYRASSPSSGSYFYFTIISTFPRLYEEHPRFRFHQFFTRATHDRWFRNFSTVNHR